MSKIFLLQSLHEKEILWQFCLGTLNLCFTERVFHLKKKKKIEEWQDLLLKANFLLRIGSCAKREIHSVARSCPTLCDTMDYTPLCSHVHGISRARILEWVAIPFSRGSSWIRDQTLISCISKWVLSLPLSNQGSPILFCAFMSVFYCNSAFSPTYD